MLHFNYQYRSFEEYLQNFAKAFESEVVNNTVWLPQHLGEGYMKWVPLGGGLNVLVNECILKTDVHFLRQANANEVYSLRFDEAKHIQKLKVRLDDGAMKETDTLYAGTFLADTREQAEYSTSSGTETRCINIFFTPDGLLNHTGLTSSSELLQQYWTLQSGALKFEVLNMEYRELMEEIFDLRETQPLYKAIFQNRIMLLVEYYLRSLYQKMGAKANLAGLDDADIKSLMLVESVLIRDLTAPPPSVKELSRIALMSETRLKTQFKKVYKRSLHEYYHRNKMIKARKMLLSGKHSVKETGTSLGFQNLSNFTIAFKKAFHLLPSELL